VASEFAPVCYVCGPGGFVERVADLLVAEDILRAGSRRSMERENEVQLTAVNTENFWPEQVVQFVKHIDAGDLNVATPKRAPPMARRDALHGWP